MMAWNWFSDEKLSVGGAALASLYRGGARCLNCLTLLFLKSIWIRPPCTKQLQGLRSIDAQADARRNPTSTQPESVLSGRTLEEIAQEAIP